MSNRYTDNQSDTSFVRMEDDGRSMRSGFTETSINRLDNQSQSMYSGKSGTIMRRVNESNSRPSLNTPRGGNNSMFKKRP